MIVVHTDLDNTLIYSYKHDIGENKHCVEVYQGREISFVTEKTGKLLKEVKNQVMMVPTTTRTLEQYQRIQLGVGEFEYALVCNGGILLHYGKEVDSWYQESLELVEESRKALVQAEELLEKEGTRCFEVRNIRNLFLFTKCEEPEKTVEKLGKMLDTSVVDVFFNGIKVYVVPKKLSKGMAIKRFKSIAKGGKILAAGDSEFDISMLKEADCGIAPESLKTSMGNMENIVYGEQSEIFSEQVLESILNIVKVNKIMYNGS